MRIDVCPPVLTRSSGQTARSWSYELEHACRCAGDYWGTELKDMEVSMVQEKPQTPLSRTSNKSAEIHDVTRNRRVDNESGTARIPTSFGVRNGMAPGRAR